MARAANDGDPQPERISTGEASGSRQRANALLCVLSDSETTVDQAERAIYKLDKASFCSIEAVKIIVSLNGVETIIDALSKWLGESKKFSLYALSVLCSVVDKDPDFQASRLIGGINIILDVVRKYPEYRKKGKGIVTLARFLFLRISLNYELGNDPLKEAAIEECVDGVIGAMKQFPELRHVQEFGCLYFSALAQIDGMKTKLDEKGVVDTLVAADANFLSKKDWDGHERAKLTLELYMEKEKK